MLECYNDIINAYIMWRHWHKMANLTESFLTLNFFFFLDFNSFDPDRVNIKHIQQLKEKEEEVEGELAALEVSAMGDIFGYLRRSKMICNLPLLLNALHICDCHEK